MRQVNLSCVQLAGLSYDSAKLDYYMTQARSRGAKLVVFGEYLFSLFFKDLQNSPKSFVNAQAKKHISELQKLAKIYKLVIVAPISWVKLGKLKKSIFIFKPTRMNYYDQKILMPYKHWNEKALFHNSIFKRKIFMINGFRFVAIFGFEAHFNEVWDELSEQNVDCVIVVSASTFDSSLRWRELLKTQAFMRGIYVLRANRIGEYANKDETWRFYGDSLWINPLGEVENHLGDKEEILFGQITTASMRRARKTWGFKKILKGQS